MHDLNQAHELLHGKKPFIFADAGYSSVEKRPELSGVSADGYIVQRPGKVRVLKQRPGINEVLLNIEHMKAAIREKAVHAFCIDQCGWCEPNYENLA